MTTNETASSERQGAIQYLRKASLQLGDENSDGLDISELRFKFTVTVQDSDTPNSAEIDVYNVAPLTAAQIQKEFTRVVVQAGYSGSFGVIFDGTIKQSGHGREKTDTYTHISAADGDAAYNFAFVETTLAAGSKPADHVDVCARVMGVHGVSKGYCGGLDGHPLPRGKVMFGMARDFMRKVADSTQTAWSIQNGWLMTISETSYLPGEVPLICFESGLLNAPTKEQHGVKFQVLLNPNIKVGGLVELDSRTWLKSGPANGSGNAANQTSTHTDEESPANGFYRVIALKHVGDTRGTDWYTEVTCQAADVTMLSASDGADGSNPDATIVKPYS